LLLTREDRFVNKTQLIDQAAAAADVSKAVAGRVLDAMFEAITSSLKNGEDVTVVGFGSFSVRDRASRTGRNPRTGEPITIAAAKIPGFKAGKSLKDAVQ
jgi:DNA-binding protein HU-beta